MAIIEDASHKESNFFLDFNTDIIRMMKIFNNNVNIRKLLYYIESDAMSRDSVDSNITFVDKSINRIPLIPLENKLGYPSSYIYINLLVADNNEDDNVVTTDIGIDIVSPLGQWIIDEGIRPLMIGNEINKIIKNQFNQVSGMKYRLTQIINVKLSDELFGYRLVFTTGIDD